jgi:hypothetical protein
VQKQNRIRQVTHIECSSDLAGVAVAQRHQTEYMDAKPRHAGSELLARSSTGECSIRASSDDQITASVIYSSRSRTFSRLLTNQSKVRKPSRSLDTDRKGLELGNQLCCNDLHR